jgi:hypothetical protein
MPQYMLLLHHDPSGWQKLSPEEQEKAHEKYMAWTKKALDSQRLAPEGGRVIRPGNGQPRVSDGPYSETKEMLGGYYTIEAASYEEAVQRALEHPHIGYGGTIEVRHVFGS